MKINNQYTSYFESFQPNSGHDMIEKDNGLTMKKDSVEVDLSKASKKMRLNNQVDNAESSKRVAEIKKAISEGTYEVSSETITNKMSELLKEQKDYYGNE
ncbi:MAG: flagellar biosynthesis anti-sigma factor FlgM [Vagococcus sp.]|uniref:flagellar biosynthesis anti-sigma factor FlgM n=1 Tax=Vagococcus sp. TaxID=1933889 RepID=UPI002FC828C4